MQLTVTTDYGIRVVLYLAQKNMVGHTKTNDGVVASSSEICEAMKIPYSYMHKIAKSLKHAGILREVRGSHGGFMLQKNLDELSLLAVIRAFEKTVNMNRCLEADEFCSRVAVSSCIVRKLYLDAQDDLHKRLDIKISTLLTQ